MLHRINYFLGILRDTGFMSMVVAFFMVIGGSAMVLVARRMPKPRPVRVRIGR